MDAKRGEPWFEDGNVILTTVDSPTAFRVHRSVMARHSEVFESMFLLPQPGTDAPPSLKHADAVMHGCPVVPMWDSPLELSNLIFALYDGTSFSSERLEDFFYLAGILRLATKYFISKLRIQAIQHLSQTWGYTLNMYDAMVEAALKSPVVDGMSYPRVHPLHVVALCKELNVRILLPCAVYCMSLYPIEDLLRGDHPKLIVQHPSRPSSSVDPHLREYTLMFQKRLDIILNFTRLFCGTRVALKTCHTKPACSEGFARLTSRLSRSWKTRTGPLHYMLQAITDLADHPKGRVCDQCRHAFAQDVAQLREKTWNELPAVLGLPAWEEMIEIDLRG